MMMKRVLALVIALLLLAACAAPAVEEVGEYICGEALLGIWTTQEGEGSVFAGREGSAQVIFEFLPDNTMFWEDGYSGALLRWQIVGNQIRFYDVAQEWTFLLNAGNGWASFLYGDYSFYLNGDELRLNDILFTRHIPVVQTFVIAVEVDEADPFSFVLRAYAEFAQWAREIRYTGYADYEEWLALLAQWEENNPLMQNFIMQPQWSFDGVRGLSQVESASDMHMEYALYDVSGNGVDDLVIQFVSWTGWRVPFVIFSLVDGVPVQQLQKAMSNNTHMRVHPGGAIQYGGRMGSYWTDLYHFVDGQLRFAMGFRSRDSWDEDMNHYFRQYITHESRDNWETATYIAVSEEEADRIWARYDTDPRGEIELVWRPLFVPA